MLKIPLVFLGLGVVVFVIFIGVLLLVFSSPNCDSLANTTAYDLKVAIDEVSKDSFYSWNKPGEVPSDSNIDYYRTSPIMLCQDKGISPLENILGTTLEPQYQIYFERFPEGGGGTWTEAYPWSGGAAASLRMWAYMRIGYGAFKISAQYLTKASIFTTYMSKLYSVAQTVKEDVSSTEIDDALEMAKLAPEVGAVPTSKTADFYIRLTKTGEAVTLVEDAARDGTLVSLSGGDVAIEAATGRFVLGKAEQVVEIPVELYENGQLTTYYVPVFVKRANGEITDMTTRFLTEADASKEGYEILKASPSDIYKDWLDTLPESLKNTYEKIYVPEDEVGPLTSIKGHIRETEFYKDFYQPSEDNLKKLLVSYDTIGYRTDFTELTTQEINGLQLGVVQAVDDPDVADMILKQDGVRDKLAESFGVSAEEIQARHLKAFIESMKLNGILFQVKGQDTEILSLGIDKIVEASNQGTVLYADGLKQAIFPEGQQIISDMSKLLGISEQDATNRLGNIIENMYSSGFYNPNLPVDQAIVNGKNEVGLYSAFTDSYLRKLAQDINSADEATSEEASVQLASFLGFVKQNKDSLPTNVVRTRLGTAVDYFKAQGKKMIYLDGPQNVLNPDSFYARALFSNLAGAGCQGNSICLYSGGAAAESPFYLNESAKNYFVRLWRPVSGVENIAGWQAAMKQVPSNPRFYVVSPCLATAKIWKATIDGKPTIFVYPEKVGVGGNASNYCYADEGMIEEYTLIWFGSDVATLINTVNGFAINKALKEATAGLTDVEEIAVATNAVKSSYSYIANKVFSIADPITLAQGMLEGAISWPTWPFAPLTWQTISANSNKIGIKEIQKGGT